MTGSDGTDQTYFQRYRDEIAAPPVDRPWPLVALAVACIAAAVIGSLGPWMTFERDAITAPETWTLYGGRTDGLFGVLFAAIALIALLVALFRPGATLAAWAAFGAMAICALIGPLDWIIFSPMEMRPDPGGRGDLVRIEWGLKLLSIAGPAGAAITFLIARRLGDRGI